MRPQAHAKYNAYSLFLKRASQTHANMIGMPFVNVYCSFLRVRVQTHAKYNVYSSFLKRASQTHANTIGMPFVNVYCSFLSLRALTQAKYKCVFFVLKACEPKHTLNTMYTLRSYSVRAKHTLTRSVCHLQ